MTAGIKGLLRSLQRTLCEDVQPELQSDHALSQLAGAIDILGKLEPLVDWAPAPLEAQETPLLDALERAQDAARAAGCPTVLVAGSTDARVRNLIDLAFDKQTGLPPALVEEIHALLLSALRESVTAQRRLISKTDFSSMTSTRDSQK